MSRTCAFCEYFDGGGLARVQVARDGGSPVLGDCHNSGREPEPPPSIFAPDPTEIQVAAFNAGLYESIQYMARLQGEIRARIAEVFPKVSAETPGGDI